MFEKKEKDFAEKKKKTIVLEQSRIIVDTKTDVHYIMTVGVGSSSITLLLDSGGNAVVDK